MRLPSLLLTCLYLSTCPAVAQSADATSPSAAKFTIEDLLNVVSVRASGMTRDGSWIVGTSATRADRIGIDNSRYGDLTYISPSVQEIWVMNTVTGERVSVFPHKKQVSNISWSPDGQSLAMFVRDGDEFFLTIWSAGDGSTRRLPLPDGEHIDTGGGLTWTSDGGKIVVSSHSSGWYHEASRRFEELTKGPILVMSSDESFLSWDALRAMRSTRSVLNVDVETGECTTLLSEDRISSSTISEDGAFLRYSEDRNSSTRYGGTRGGGERGGGGQGGGLRVLDVGSGETRTIDTDGARLTWAPDGVHYTIDRSGRIFLTSLRDEGEPRQIAGPPPEEEGAEEEEPTEESRAAAAERAAERLRVQRLSRGGGKLIASNRKGLWLMDTASGEQELIVETPTGDDAPQYSVTGWMPERGIVYVTYSSRTAWEQGLLQYNANTDSLVELVKDNRQYGGYQFARDGSSMVFTMNNPGQPSDLYSADGNMADVRRLTDSNPQLDPSRVSSAELLEYLDVDGRELKGVIYYPQDYQKGQTYPTIFLVYESFFAPRFNTATNVLTARGYVVVQPSVRLETGYPSEAWLKGVTAAANKMIEMGVSDPKRLGVQGTSYGGYATNLLITQTDRFKAAINVSGKVNMVSFYTDSPRLGIRNIRAPESGQDRIGATLWEQPQKYITHSAVMFTDRIKTPLLLITGELDANVPARQAMEMYYAMRRLGKTVTWVNYMNGGHGMPTSTLEEVRDYHNRILAWYDQYLKPAETEDTADIGGERGPGSGRRR